MSDYTKMRFTSTEDPDRSIILPLPATPEQFQEAMRSIGAEAIGTGCKVTDFASDVPALDQLLAVNSDAVIDATPDELNYAAARIAELTPTQRRLLDAVSESSLRLRTLERGAFTAHGYVLPTGDEWTPHFEKSRSIPETYRITGARPSVRERLKSEKPKTPKARKHDTPDQER